MAFAEPIPRVERLAEAEPARRSAGLAALATGLLFAAAEVLVFEWDPADMILGALLGACVWGTLLYLTDTAKLVRHEGPPSCRGSHADDPRPLAGPPV